MQLEAVEVAAFAGGVTAEGFFLIDVAARNANVVADGNRKGVDAVDVLLIQGFLSLRQHGKQERQEEMETMRPPIEAAAAQHAWYVAFGL